jgi:hypothetical protein
MNPTQEYFSVLLRQSERSWVVLCYCPTRQQAEMIQNGMITKCSNYDAQNLRVLSRSEAKHEFGLEWEHFFMVGISLPESVRVRKTA